MLCVEPPVSRRNDAALFEEVLWQPTAEEAENELDEQSADKTDDDKRGLLGVCVLRGRRHETMFAMYLAGHFSTV